MVGWAGLIISGVISAVASVAGGVMAYQRGRQEQKMMNYQAAMTQQEIQLTERKAQQEEQLTQYKASQDAKQLQRKYMVLEGEAKAARAASGLGGGSVSEGDIATDIFNTENEDLFTIRRTADIASWNIRENAKIDIWSLESQKEQYEAAGKNAARAGKQALAMGILVGAGSIASSVAGAKTAQNRPTDTTPQSYAGYGGQPSYSFRRTDTGGAIGSKLSNYSTGGW